MFENIKKIIEECLGEPIRENNGWLEYNCPYCCQELGIENDNKYNLALNYGEDGVNKPYFHCWKCETSGKLSKIVRDFGNSSLFQRYKETLKEIRLSSEYRLFNDFEDKHDNGENFYCELPKDYRKITVHDKYARDVIEYLNKRRISNFFIEKYKIGYVPYFSDDTEMRSRVIIPSYDEYGELNYFVARDYTGKRKYKKYNNPTIPKTHFIFNEYYLNYYEDITLVEGVFDHMVIPNSIPLLGKSLKKENAVFEMLMDKAKTNVNILLDDDAQNDAKKIYKFLNSTKLRDRVRLIECPQGYDASEIYQKFGRKGMVRLMSLARKLDEYELVNI